MNGKLSNTISQIFNGGSILTANRIIEESLIILEPYSCDKPCSSLTCRLRNCSGNLLEAFDRDHRSLICRGVELRSTEQERALAIYLSFHCEIRTIRIVTWAGEGRSRIDRTGRIQTIIYKSCRERIAFYSSIETDRDKTQSVFERRSRRFERAPLSIWRI